EIEQPDVVPRPGGHPDQEADSLRGDGVAGVPEAERTLIHEVRKLAVRPSRVGPGIGACGVAGKEVKEGSHGLVNRTMPLWTHRPPAFRIRRISPVCTVGPIQVTQSTGGMLLVSTSAEASSGKGK